MKHTLSRILLAVGLLLVAGDALAQATQAVQINASVARSCAFSGVTDVTFPSAYDPNAAAGLEGTGQVLIQCTKGTTFYWTIDDGGHPAGTRRLADAAVAEFIPYTIEGSSNGGTSYTAAPLGMLVGQAGARSTGRLGDMPLDLRVTLTAGQDVSTDIGVFSDTVNVEVDIAP